VNFSSYSGFNAYFPLYILEKLLNQTFLLLIIVRKEVKKRMKVKSKMVGKWAFLVGLLISVIASFLTGYAGAVALVLFLLGLVVGFLNITEKDSNKFLLAAIALLTGGLASISAISVIGLGGVTAILSKVLGNFLAFVGAAALVVAIKVVFETGKD
jgi:hypothetical protein